MKSVFCAGAGIQITLWSLNGGRLTVNKLLQSHFVRQLPQ